RCRDLSGQLRWRAQRPPRADRRGQAAGGGGGAHVRSAPRQGVAARARPALDHAAAPKLELLQGAGVPGAVVQPFTLEYAKTPAQAFEASLLEGLRVAHVIVGYDFTYGTKRSGTVQTLGAACAVAGAQLAVVPAVTVDGVVVSSSRVREYVL